jgi:hypothetical protein
MTQAKVIVDSALEVRQNPIGLGDLPEKGCAVGAHVIRMVAPRKRVERVPKVVVVVDHPAT